MSHMGVEFRAVKGRYKAGTNPVEAKTIIELIIEFMQNDPDRSLGVVTLNQRQRDLIMEEFEYAIANNCAVQRYIDTWKEKNDGLEEFFIKNLENVQGDERDVIFIGTVYGAEEPGRASDAALWSHQWPRRQAPAECFVHAREAKGRHLLVDDCRRYRG